MTSTTKWSYLIESDVTLRKAARDYTSSPTAENAVAYAGEILRAPVNRPGARFERLKKEFESSGDKETADALIIDYKRVQSHPRDKEISRHCNLRGKMGNYCKQANQTEIATKHFTILVSYNTPVAYAVIKTGDEFYTSERHSVTTTAHIRRWSDTSAKAVSQAELDDIYGDI